MSTEDETIYLATRAQAIMDDPLVKQVLAAMRQANVDLFFGTPIEQADVREQLHMMDRARQHFEAAFNSLIVGGAVERANRSDDQASSEAMIEIMQRVKGR